MITEEKQLKAIEALGELIAAKDKEIELKDWQIRNRDERINALMDQLDYTAKEKAVLEEKIFELQERISIMTESEAPEEAADFEPDPELKKEGE